MADNLLTQYEIVKDTFISLNVLGEAMMESKSINQTMQIVLPQYKNFEVKAWRILDDDHSKKHLIVDAEAETLRVQRTITIYMDIGVVESVDVLLNDSEQVVVCDLPHPFDVCVQRGVDMHVEMLTGGGNFTGSHILRDETPAEGIRKNYYSNEKPRVIRVDGLKKSKRKFVEGTAVWQEFFAVRNNEGGFHVTFDYAGIWKASVKNNIDHFSISVSFPDEQVFIPAHGSLALPITRFGAYTGDLDALGNHILNFSYQHKWDFTNPDYLAKPNAFMFWINDEHTSMPQCENAFWIVRNAQTIGAEIVHVDDFWYDKKGNWNNIGKDDFAELNTYAQKCGLKISVWYAPWHADYDSEPFKNHRNWRVKKDKKQWYGGHFDLSCDEACAWQEQLMCSKQEQWGPHMIKYDGEPLWPSDGSLRCMPKASENWYRLLKEFRTNYPTAGVFGCASGGELMGIEALRFSDLHCVTDELVRHYNGYYNTILTPPDKIMGGGRNVWGKPYNPESRSEWKTEVQINMNQADLPANADDVELLRQDIERYRFFQTKGCVGRGVQVFRPLCTGMDKTLVLQKMSADQQRGYITIDTSLSPRHSAVTIYPKGMISDQTYTLRAIAGSFEPERRLGEAWMRDGITIDSINVGEMICMNLEDMPGIKKEAYVVPDPVDCKKQVTTIMGHDGVVISWKIPEMSQWYSYSLIICDGKKYAIASVGEYCFLPNANPQSIYEVQLYDGYGNYSNAIKCS